MGLTGLSATSTLGSLTAKSDATISLSGLSATASVGALDPTAVLVGLTGLSATSTGINLTKVLTSSQNIMGPTGIRCNLAVYDASGTLLNTATT